MEALERARSPYNSFKSYLSPITIDPTIEDSYIQHTEVDKQWCILDGK